MAAGVCGFRALDSIHVEKSRPGERVDRREQPARADGVVDGARVRRRVARGWTRQDDAVAEFTEYGLVARDADRAVQRSALILLPQPHTAVRVRARERDDAPVLEQRVPAIQRGGPVQEPRQRGAGPQPVPEPGAEQRSPALVAPFAVAVQPLDPVDRCVRIGPAERTFRRIGVSGNAESSQPRDVFDDGLRGAAERIRRAGHVDRHVVAVVGADLDGVEHEDAVEVLGRIRRPRRVAVVGEDDELQIGARRGGRDFTRVAVPVRSGGVDVIRARHRARRQVVPLRAGAQARRRGREHGEQERRGQQRGAGGNGRRPVDGCETTDGRVADHRQPSISDQPSTVRRSALGTRQSAFRYLPSARSAAALSVRSQVNSGSVRPKWPNAAVFL